MLCIHVLLHVNTFSVQMVPCKLVEQTNILTHAYCDVLYDQCVPVLQYSIDENAFILCFECH